MAKKPETARLTNKEAIDQAINDDFAAIYVKDCQRLERMENEVKPVAKSINKMWKELSAKTGYAVIDLKDQYRIFKRSEDAEALEDEKDRDRIRDNQRGIFAALVRAKTMNFMQIVTGVDYTPTGVVEAAAMQEAGAGETAAAGAALAQTKH